ncbi:hypothetical protein SAMN04488028_10566 [Reichenbachiella agariperforans]|uniref:Uncharacterized protein n=1 Tax=Reichenbachiella agariperforans TaxID=156994 RepID=A0A1M6SLJ3_REIAG|nr:hypothetical protein [Reichenbachiella agariperforans]SHK45654.1 hypothetical protein SAMN04488028_10566 [Reichenbachiella agariperforans]
MQYYKLLLISLVACFGCTSELETDFSRLGVQYFPMEVGAYRIYDVHDTNYYLIGPEEENYQLKEEVVDSTIISDTEVRYQLHRSKRADETAVWKLDSVWTTSINTTRVVAVENNVSFVKLVFPIEENLSWDGNSYNNRQSEFYQYGESQIDTVLAEQAFTNVVQVIQSNQGIDPLIGRDDRLEYYAPEVGLIIKYHAKWAYDQEDGIVNTDKIVAGRQLEQTLITYGKKQD